MKKVLIIFLLVLLVCISGCDADSANAETTAAESVTTTVEIDTTEETTSDIVNQEKAKMVEMFAKYGTYYDDGVFRFSSSNNQYGTFTIYTFAYSPSTDIFSCSYAVYTYQSTSTPASGGSVNFRWGDMDNAYFSGYYAIYDAEVNNLLDNLEFIYTVNDFKQNMQLGDYRYEIIDNTFSGLSTSEINIHAVTCFDYILQGANYAQSVISIYNSGISIWP